MEDSYLSLLQEAIAIAKETKKELREIKQKLISLEEEKEFDLSPAEAESHLGISSQWIRDLVKNAEVSPKTSPIKQGRDFYRLPNGYIRIVVKNFKKALKEGK
jgi:hypothetical protein